MSWRSAALLREAWRNTAANPLRTAALVVLVAAALGIPAGLELRQAGDLARFEREYAAAGGYVAIAAGQPEPLDAGRCEALDTVPGVVAAGGKRQIGTVSFSVAPGLLFQSAAVTEGAIRVWAPAAGPIQPPPGEWAVLGAAAAEELGLTAGSMLAPAARAPLEVAAVVDTERRNPQAQRWLLEVAPASGVVDECWVEFDRASHASGTGVLAAWFAQESKEPVIRPYIRAGEFTRDPLAEFAGRPQRFAWVAAGAFIAALAALASWFRRAEFGLYLAMGTSRSDLYLLTACELWLVALAGAALGFGAAVAASVLGPDAIAGSHLVIAGRASLAGLAFGTLLAPALVVLMARGNIASMLKER